MLKYLVQDIEGIPETELQPLWEAEKAKLLAEGNTRDTRFEPLWAWKVISIGMLVLDSDLKPVQGGCAAGGLSGGKSEKEMIQRWSDVVSGKFWDDQNESLRMVDWYGSRFDVPVLQTRAFRYGIQLPWLFDLQPDNRGGISQWSKEYRDKFQGKHDDVSELWTNRGSFQRPHLESLAVLMGLPGKVGIDGSKVYDAYKAGQHREIDTYCMQDVIQTAFVFQRFKYMSGKITLDAYRAAAEALLEWTRRQDDQAYFAAHIDRNALFIEDGVSSANADSDHRRDDLVSPGSGGDTAEPPVQGAVDLHQEGSV
jgi:predicted PolB exonuclease-like 3'-5' exonuclease